MIPAALIKKIELGPRQMTFGFEGRMTAGFEVVFSVIEKECQTGGAVVLDHLMSRDPLPSDLTAPEILQIIFWLAEELKVHFLVEERPSSPKRTKQRLLESPSTPVLIVVNRQVDSNGFERMKKAAIKFLPALPEGVDQYQFSRIFIQALKTWQKRLKSYAPKAKQPHFPGGKEIRNSLALLDRILEKQDSHSVILTGLKYRSKIIRLAETIGVLTRFYEQKLSFWEMMLERMQAFEVNLPEIKKDPQVSAGYQRLCDIAAAPDPFSLVAEAEDLLPGVQAFHQQIEHRKIDALRKGTLEKTEKMLSKLAGLFDTFESDQEYRNQILYELRAVNKRIENSGRPEEIRALYNDAKDLFVDVIEDI